MIVASQWKISSSLRGPALQLVGGSFCKSYFMTQTDASQSVIDVRAPKPPIMRALEIHRNPPHRRLTRAQTPACARDIHAQYSYARHRAPSRATRPSRRARTPRNAQRRARDPARGAAPRRDSSRMRARNRRRITVDVARTKSSFMIRLLAMVFGRSRRSRARGRVGVWRCRVNRVTGLGACQRTRRRNALMMVVNRAHRS